MALRFSDALAEKFDVLSHNFSVSVDTLWAMCKLQRCDSNGDQYFSQSLPLQDELEDHFDDVEDAVVEALETTERTSSMIKNPNGCVRTHIRNRQEIGFCFLDLLRCFMNHNPIVRSSKTVRKGKSPAEVLSGKTHPHWLELMGYERFKRAA